MLLSLIPLLEAQLRQAELGAVGRLDPRIRATARRLVDALLAGWEEWRASSFPRPEPAEKPR